MTNDEIIRSAFPVSYKQPGERIMTTIIIDRAVVEQALEALEYGQHSLKQVGEYQWESRGELAMQALRAALAEPEQEQEQAEPVAFVNAVHLQGLQALQMGAHLQGLPLGLYGYVEIYTEESAGRVPLYAAPPRRKPLTDEQIVAINDKHYNIAYRDFDADIAIARAIEAAHGIGEE